MYQYVCYIIDYMVICCICEVGVRMTIEIVKPDELIGAVVIDACVSTDSLWAVRLRLTSGEIAEINGFEEGSLLVWR